MRIRSIKPEFWRSEDITALDWETRLLFIGLWSYVDDNGVGRDVEKLILADLFPLEENPRETLATVSRGLLALSERGLIVRYYVNGKPFLEITGWASHQRIDKPNKARYEPVTCGNAVIRDTLATPSRDSSETLAPGTGEQGNRGTEEQGAREQTLLRDKSRDGDDLPRFDEFWETYGKKRDRKKCETAYRAALKKPGVTGDLLVAAAAAYITWQMSEGKHPEFTKDPLTWLHGENWTDERPARQASAAPESNAQGWLRLANEIAEQDGGNVSPFRAIGGDR
ncbi:MAG: hypothetical protein JWO15_3891 [Sphingomonadales bacterium]|nr:hypothetical protein [Sphingomonadales bacterium]